MLNVLDIFSGIGGNLGNYKVIPCNGIEEIRAIIRYVKKRRKQRGYILYYINKQKKVLV